MITYIWRLIRPHVYSINDYANLAEKNPGAVTMREAKLLNRMQLDARRLEVSGY